MTSPLVRFGLGLSALCIAWLGSAREASATGRYDPATGLFYLSYTYARLPNDTNEDRVLLSEEVPRTAELDALVAQFYQDISDDLGKLTGGRGYLAPAQYTSDLRTADVVISPDVPYSIDGQLRGGWGTLNGFSAHYGQLAIYIQSLKQGGYSSPGQRLTVAHELCHYLFGVPDEYNAQYCPMPGPLGQGCLMDNYNTRTWPGFLCNDSSFLHNPAAVTYKDPSIPAEKSCQQIVDDFFATYKVGKNAKFNPPSGGATVAGNTSASGGGLGTALATQVQDKARTLILDRKAKGLPTDKKSLVRKLMGTVFDLLKDSGVTSPSNLQSVAELALESVGVPPIVPKTLEKLAPLFEAEAKRLAQSLANKPGRNLSILDGLIKFAANPGSGNAPASVATPDELSYLNDLAKQVAGTVDSQTIDPDKAQIVYLSQIASKLDAILVDQNVPGAVGSRAISRKLYADLTRLGALPSVSRDDPFKTARGTLVIAPPLVVSEFSGLGLGLDEVLVHPGVFRNYNDLRRQCVRQFDDLIDKGRVDPVYGHRFGTGEARTTLLSAGLGRGVGAGAVQSFEAGIDLDDQEGYKAGNRVPTRQAALGRQRSERILGLIDIVYEGIYRDTIKNVAVLVPPGGLPAEVAGRLDSLKPLVIGKTDLRLDVVQVGSAPITRQLRDLSARSGGSVFTVTDQDEVGAVAQRLAIDQSQGTWVSLPIQGTILFDVRKPDVAPPPPLKGPAEYTLFHRMSGERYLYPIGKNPANGTPPPGSSPDNEARMALRPFYVDAGSSYQFVAGFSTDLNVPVADNPGAMDSDSTPELRLVKTRINEEDPAQRQALEQPRGRAFRDIGTPNLRFESERSSTKVLVFTMPPASGQGVLEGWYTPVLVLKRSNFLKFVAHDTSADRKSRDKELMRRDKELMNPPTYRIDDEKGRDDENQGINFTFSVGTQHSNAQLIPTLLQDAPKDPTASYRGTLSADARVAVIQVQLLVGAPVKNAAVRGYYERIEVGKSRINFEPISFQDQGLMDDKVADDGIYSGRIPLPPGSRPAAEYRVIIVAEHRDKTADSEGTAYINLSEVFPPTSTDQAAKDQVAKELAKVTNRRVPRFQRATSLNFRVEGDAPDAAMTASPMNPAASAPVDPKDAREKARKALDDAKSILKDNK